MESVIIKDSNIPSHTGMSPVRKGLMTLGRRSIIVFAFRMYRVKWYFHMIHVWIVVVTSVQTQPITMTACDDSIQQLSSFFLNFIPGPTGGKGSKGDDGDKGETGRPGTSGRVGPSGTRGPTGRAGVDGDKGDIGRTGPRGEDGPTGGDTYYYRIEHIV